MTISQAILSTSFALLFSACGQHNSGIEVMPQKFVTVDSTLKNFNALPFEDTDTLFYGMSQKNSTVTFTTTTFQKLDNFIYTDTMGSCDCYKIWDTLVITLKRNTGFAGSCLVNKVIEDRVITTRYAWMDVAGSDEMYYIDSTEITLNKFFYNSGDTLLGKIKIVDNKKSNRWTTAATGLFKCIIRSKVNDRDSTSMTQIQEHADRQKGNRH